MRYTGRRVAMEGYGRGKVYLVGAGPGDPGLMTLKGKTLLERAEVVVYDYLVSDQLLRWCREDAELVYVGKQSGKHTLSQSEINELLVQKARSGSLVVRLKGGDPFIFGRGGEEAEVLERQGIPFEIVPGVSSAVAAPAYAGIPLTHRRCASSVAIVTGHEDPQKPETQINWEHLAKGADTLVFLMGVKNLSHIAKELMAHGRDPKTLAAVIRWGTTTQQRTVTATLEGIAQEARRAKMNPPAILVVGEVVRLRERLAWFERGPLFGRRVVVTRSREQASELAERLHELGAEPLELPTIAIREPRHWGELDAGLDRVGSYQWILFTSANGVRFFAKRLVERGGDIRGLKGLRIGAIGPGTAQAIELLSLRVDIMPSEFRAEALAEAFSTENLVGKRFLIPRAREARDALPELLRGMGAEVDVVSAYETVVPQGGAGRIGRMFLDKQVDAVTFTSSSTVRNFIRMMGETDVPELLDGVVVACIGPVTAETAMELGIQPHVQPKDYTIPGLVEALVDYFQKKNPPHRGEERTGLP
jgi:uroporphyrinogen III methyltransferase / synthase